MDEWTGKNYNVTYYDSHITCKMLMLANPTDEKACHL